MTRRERVLAVLEHRQPDRVPREVKFTPPALETFRKNSEAEDPAEYFDLEMREVMFDPPAEIADFSRYYPEGVPTLPLDRGWEVGEWGVGTRPGSEFHFVRIVHPMTNLKTIEELEEYPFPDPLAPERHAHLDEEVEQLKLDGLAVVGYMEWTIWEMAWLMRGMERLFEDMVVNPEFAVYLFDRVTEIRCGMARRMAEAGVDVLRIGDDVGTQKGMLMSPDMWREWLKPRLREVIESARSVRSDIEISYHSDGQVYPIIPELIEVGVTVLNPVQPECMDPFRVAEEYGRDLTLWGCLGTQTTMPFGSPDEVRRVVTQLARELGPGGGFVLSPTHVLEPEVPWENMVAMFEAVDNIWFDR